MSAQAHVLLPPTLPPRNSSRSPISAGRHRAHGSLFPGRRLRTPRSAELGDLAMAAARAGSLQADDGGMRACSRPEVAVAIKAAYRAGLGDWTEAGQLPVVYHKDYNISFFGLERLHPFDPCKYQKVRRFLCDKELLPAGHTLAPVAASDDMLADIHCPKYIKSVSTSPWMVAQICELAPLAMLPNFVVQNRVVKSMRRMTCGTMLAAGVAMQHGWAVNLGGGMHHASRDQGQGWCMFDDHYLALRMLRSATRSCCRESCGAVRRALYIDLDVHQGNGVCRDKLLLQDPDLYVMDVYNADVFPQDKHAERAVDCGVRLHCGAADKEYLSRLREALGTSFASSSPDVVFYNAGTDILAGDPLGRLNVSKQGIVQRDEMVFQACLEARVPVVMALSGGYTAENWRVISESLHNLFIKFKLTAT
mmetsp:Transcript_15598/g.39647  ORF Transcript_15598/g.39647 Transcript_15598/m.39647 type:complete len:421 (+) Transcript_15598:216-1478(+)